MHIHSRGGRVRIRLGEPVPEVHQHRSPDGYVYYHVHQKNPTRYRRRAGGGMASLVPETGNWRPAVTHHTVCPKENQWRNVAVVNKLSSGVLRLVCEMCDWTWLYRAADAPTPLLPGFDGSLRREFMGVYPGQRRQHAERGA